MEETDIGTEYVDESWTEGLEGGTFVDFRSGPVTLEFLQGAPYKRKNSWGKDVWSWDVVELDENLKEISKLILSTASKRLRRALAAHVPLTHRILRVSRSGENMETKYSATELSRKGSDVLV